MPALRRAVTLLPLLVPGAALGAQAGGGRAAIVLALPAAPRAAALAEAVVAVDGDETALFHSPAQLAGARPAAGASVERFLAGTTLAAAAASVRVAGGVAAVGVRSLAYPEGEETIEYVPTGRTLTGGELAVTAGWARAVRALGGLRLGAAATIVRQRVAEASGRAVAGDVGVAWRAGDGTTIAAAVQHAGGALSLLGRASPLPRRARVGAARPFALAATVRLLTTVEASRVRGEGVRPAVGAELRWRRGRLTLDARGGVRRRLDRDEAMPAQTVGAGLGVRALALDYAYQGYGALGATHRLGVRWAP